MAGYNIWANNLVEDWVSRISLDQWETPIVSSFGSIAATILHITGAEKVWLDRLNYADPIGWLPTEFKGSREELLATWSHASAGLKQFLENFDEARMMENISFKRINGDAYLMPYYQVFAHVFNHSTFHRGQVVTLLRQVGFTDVGSTDLLGFYRLKN